MPIDPAVISHLVIAMVSGLAVGVERQWSGHASGPNARLGGLRTFTMLGILAGMSGLLWISDARPLAVVLLSAAGALIAIGYFRASRTDIDGTTEVAAIIVLTAGVLAGMGVTTLAAGITALTVLLLIEKSRLHSWVTHINNEGIEAGARFAVMALVILPLLPAGPYGPYDAIRPRELWALVLFFSGLSFCSYVIRRTVGSEEGFAISGILGGFISSTSVTITMSRLSRTETSVQGALASGVMGANTMLFLRVLIATAVLAPALPRHLVVPFAAPFLVGAVLTAWGMRTKRSGPPQEPHGENPLQFATAIEMAVLFQLVLLAIVPIHRWLGEAGAYIAATVLGLTQVDAVILSETKSLATGTPIEIAARAILIGILANTIFKTGVVLVMGRGKYRLWAGAGLTLMAAALGAGILFAMRTA